MNTLRAQINTALDALVEEKNGFAFQRLACQCLRSRWPSLASVAERADLGEDAITILGETSDRVVRSLACSLTAEWTKVYTDAQKVALHRSDVSEFIFATPKTVTREEQKTWEGKIQEEFSWKLIVIERSEFLSILERPESQWIRDQHLSIPKKDQTAETLNEAAGQFWAKGANADARTLYSMAHSAALSAGNDRAACHALAGLAWCALVEKDLISAHAHATTCRDLADKAGSLHYRASALLLSARVAFFQRDLEEAERCALSAFEDGRKAKSVVRYDAQALLVEVALARDDADTALRYLNPIYRREVKLGGRRAIAAYDLRAGIQLARGKLRLAASIFDRAASEAKSLGNLELHASYLAKAQRALADAGAHRAVLKRSERCESSANAIDNAPLLLEILMSKSWAYRQLRKPKESLRVLERVAAVAESKSCHDLAARAFIGHAQMLRAEGDLVGSRLAAEKGLSFARASGCESLVGLAQLEMADHYSASGEFEEALKRYDDAVIRFRDTRLPADLQFEQAQTKLRILDGLGKYAEATSTLDEIVTIAKQVDLRWPRALEWVEAKKKEFDAKANGFEAVSRMLRAIGDDAKKWAGTVETKTLNEAHQWIIGTLMDWWDGTHGGVPAPTDVFNLWGEANYGRVILNHRAYRGQAFHLCVDVSNVDQARAACRMLAPLCDCLTLVWKGELVGGIAIGLPRHLFYDQPTPKWKPRPKDHFNKAARLYPLCMPPVLRFLLPYEVVNFFLDEARELTGRGRLMLVPGPGVGCMGRYHKFEELMFCQVACANAVVKTGETLQISPHLDMVVPWFPKIPLKDLAALCDDHETNFAEFRRKCMEWGDTVREKGGTKVSRIHADILALAKDLDRLFRRIKGDANPDGEMAVGSLTGSSTAGDARQIPRDSMQTDVTRRLRSLAWDEIDGNPWFPYWSFEQSGVDWQLGSAVAASGGSEDIPISVQGAVLSGNAYHWLRAPGEHKMYVALRDKDGNVNIERIRTPTPDQGGREP